MKTIALEIIIIIIIIIILAINQTVHSTIIPSVFTTSRQQIKVIPFETDDCRPTEGMECICVKLNSEEQLENYWNQRFCGATHVREDVQLIR